jgi:hypothetical protein
MHKRLPKQKLNITSLLVFICLLFGPLAAHGQVFVYSGREYSKVGRSYSQIRSVDIATGKQTQLSKSMRYHNSPWCASDGSILFTVPDEKAIYRLDPASGTEHKIMPIDQNLAAVIGELDDQRIVVQEYADDFQIEILDLKMGRSIRKISGLRASISPDHKLIAYEFSPSIPDQKQVPHVYITEIQSGNVLDLGEGATPTFLPTQGKLVYTHPEKTKNAPQIEIVIYDLNTGKSNSKIFTADEAIFPEFADLTVAPDGGTMVLASAGGGHGSSVYYLLRSGSATVIDSDLLGWAGWSSNNLLLYGTDRILRALDKNRSVWVTDIKVFDSHTGSVRTIKGGISLNLDPQWCTPHNLLTKEASRTTQH